MRKKFFLKVLSLTLTPLSVVHATTPESTLQDEDFGVIPVGLVSISIEHGLLGGSSLVLGSPKTAVWTLDNTASVFSTNSEYTETSLGSDLTSESLNNIGGIFATSAQDDGRLLAGGKSGVASQVAAIWTKPSGGSWTSAIDTVSNHGAVLFLSNDGLVAAGMDDGGPTVWDWDSVSSQYTKRDYLASNPDRPNPFLPDNFVTDDAAQSYNMNSTHGAITSMSDDGNTAIGVMNHTDADRFTANKTFIWRKSSSQTFRDVTPVVIDSFVGAPDATDPSGDPFVPDGYGVVVADDSGDVIVAGSSPPDFDSICNVRYGGTYPPYGVSLYSLTADGNTAVGDNFILIDRPGTSGGSMYRRSAAVYSYNDFNGQWDEEVLPVTIAVPYPAAVVATPGSEPFFDVTASAITRDGQAIIGNLSRLNGSNVEFYKTILWKRDNDQWVDIELGGWVGNTNYLGGAIESYNGKFYIGGYSLNYDTFAIEPYLWIVDGYNNPVALNIPNAQAAILEGVVNQQNALSGLMNNLEFISPRGSLGSSEKTYALRSFFQNKTSLSSHIRLSKSDSTTPMLTWSSFLTVDAKENCKPVLDIKLGHALLKDRALSFNYQGIQSRLLAGVDYKFNPQLLLRPSVMKLWAKANLARLGGMSDTEYAAGDARFNGTGISLEATYDLTLSNQLRLNLAYRELTRSAYTEEETVTPITYNKHQQHSTTLQGAYIYTNKVSSAFDLQLTAHGLYKIDESHPDLAIQSATFPGMSSGVSVASPESKRFVAGAQVGILKKLSENRAVSYNLAVRQSEVKSTGTIWSLSIGYSA